MGDQGCKFESKGFGSSFFLNFVGYTRGLSHRRIENLNFIIFFVIFFVGTLRVLSQLDGDEEESARLSDSDAKIELRQELCRSDVPKTNSAALKRNHN